MCTATAGDGCDVPEMQARSRVQTFTVNYIITTILRTVKIPAIPIGGPDIIPAIPIGGFYHK